MLHHLFIALRRRPYDILLALLIFMVFAGGEMQKWATGSLLVAVVAAFVPLAAIAALVADRTAARLGVVLAVPATGAMLQGALGMRLVPDWVVLVCPLGIFVLASWVIVRHLVTQRSVDANLVRGGVCGYLMIGYTWAIAYQVVAYLVPGSFRVGGELTTGGLESGSAVYLSFVTLTTLGYGDIVPADPLSRSLAVSEGIIGVMYLAIIVSRLVGAYQGRQEG